MLDYQRCPRCEEPCSAFAEGSPPPVAEAREMLNRFRGENEAARALEVERQARAEEFERFYAVRAANRLAAEIDAEFGTVPEPDKQAPRMRWEFGK